MAEGQQQVELFGNADGARRGCPCLRSPLSPREIISARLQSRATPSALGDRAPACGPGRSRAELHRNSAFARCRRVGPRPGARLVAWQQRTQCVPCVFNPVRRIRRNARNHDYDFGYHLHSDADKRHGVRYHGVAFSRGAGQWDDARCRTQEECAQPGSWADSVRPKLRRMRFNGRTINKSTGSPTSK